VFEDTFLRKIFGFKNDEVIMDGEFYDKDLNFIPVSLQHINGGKLFRLSM
jgi:hypothetical protein